LKNPPLFLIGDKLAHEILSLQMFLEQTHLLTLPHNVRNVQRLALFVLENPIGVQIHDVLAVRVDIAENVGSH
jgi:hypothetical protein